MFACIKKLNFIDNVFIYYDKIYDVWQSICLVGGT